MNSDSKDKEGVCYFLKSRLPTAQSTVNGEKVIELRDTGCTRCVFRRWISDDQLIGKESDVTLIDETTQGILWRLLILIVHFVTGKIEALCMEDTLYDLVIGNIDGSKLPDMSHFSAAAVTIYQGKQRHIGNLRSLIRLLMEIRKLYSKQGVLDVFSEEVGFLMIS